MILVNILAANWGVAEWRRLGSIYGNAGLAARIITIYSKSWKKIPKLIIDAILNEVERAETKFPDWPSDMVHAAAIVGEESGELTRAALQWTYEGGDIIEAQKEAISRAAGQHLLLRNAFAGDG